MGRIAAVSLLVTGLLVAVVMAVVGALSPPARAQGSAERPVADIYLRVDLSEGGGHPWTAAPAQFVVPLGAKVAIEVPNPPEHATPHNLRIGGPYKLESAIARPGETVWLVFTADQAGDGIPWWCAIAGHRQLGMQGTLTVRP